MSRIIIPVDMLSQAKEALRKHAGYPHKDSCETRELGILTTLVLHAALLWLSEQVPVTEQGSTACEGLMWDRNLQAKDIGIFGNVSIDANPSILKAYRRGVEEGQSSIRRMFLAAETEHRKEIFHAKYGTSGAVVCSCGFATTFWAMTAEAEERGIEFFERRHEEHLKESK